MLVFTTSHSDRRIKGDNEVLFEPRKGRTLTLLKSLPETLHVLFNVHSKSLVVLRLVMLSPFFWGSEVN